MWHCELWSKEPEPWEDPIWDTIGTYEEVKKTAQEHYESQYRILPKN